MEGGSWMGVCAKDPGSCLCLVHGWTKGSSLFGWKVI